MNRSPIKIPQQGIIPASRNLFPNLIPPQPRAKLAIPDVLTSSPTRGDTISNFLPIERM
jgi:hypothetical protein